MATNYRFSVSADFWQGFPKLEVVTHWWITSPHMGHDFNPSTNPCSSLALNQSHSRSHSTDWEGWKAGVVLGWWPTLWALVSLRWPAESLEIHFWFSENHFQFASENQRCFLRLMLAVLRPGKASRVGTLACCLTIFLVSNVLQPTTDDEVVHGT